MKTDLSVPDRECHICKRETTYLVHLMLNGRVHVTIPLCINHFPKHFEVEIIEDGTIFKSTFDSEAIQTYPYGIDDLNDFEPGNEDGVTMLNKMLGHKND